MFLRRILRKFRRQCCVATPSKYTKVDVSKRKLCVMLMGTCWLFLLFSANLAHFSLTYERYIIATQFRNNSVNFLFISQPEIFSNQSKITNGSLAHEFQLKSGLTETVKKHTSNVTKLMLPKVKTQNASVLRHNKSRHNSDSETKVDDVMKRQNHVLNNTTAKFKANNTNYKLANLYNRSTINNIKSINNQTTVHVHEKHGFLNNISEVLKKADFGEAEHLDTIPKYVIESDKVIEILDAEVNTSSIQEDFIIPAYSHDLIDKAALINENIPTGEEMPTEVDTKDYKHPAISMNEPSEPNSNKVNEELHNVTKRNNSQAKGLVGIGKNQKNYENLGNNSSENLQKNIDISDQPADKENSDTGSAKTSEIVVKQTEQNGIVKTLSISNQTSNVMPQNDNKHVANNVSNETQSSSNSERTGNQTNNVTPPNDNKHVRNNVSNETQSSSNSERTGNQTSNVTQQNVDKHVGNNVSNETQSSSKSERTGNQTSNVTPPNDNKHVGNNVSNETQSSSNSERTGNQTSNVTQQNVDKHVGNNVSNETQSSSKSERTGNQTSNVTPPNDNKHVGNNVSNETQSSSNSKRTGNQTGNVTQPNDNKHVGNNVLNETQSSSNSERTANQTGNVTPPNDNKHVGNNVSNETRESTNNKRTINQTSNMTSSITRTNSNSSTSPVNRFILDSNCSTRVTGVEDILCMKRPQFSPDFLNPCWYQGGKIKCLPYFHIIGVCKTGTTDLFKRLTHHPQILKNRGLLGKETWYWTWRRYGHANFYRSSIRQITLGNFIDHFDARAIEHVTRKTTNGTLLYHPAVTGHGDPMDFWDHSSWKKIPQNDPTADLPVVNTPSLIKHII
ncbi:GATA zinc finger domain-containing protein 14-like isoform X2 [Ruditapes philippinarum]|uniref:GATA zinc finger domain-containing protein 14-like isoform X2 n=1 Tax=Ruditapes philippinarum TaxID=129788 RepID=UPI00295BB2D0|nr:GATA zinc finger domain-containing protein 14-like isoform X2 [Ruditapes philippinarum]